MKEVFILFFANLVAITSVGGAIYLAALGITGWGWFLFVAVLTVSGFKYSDRNDSRE